MKIAAAYIGFAVIAIGINLLVQALVTAIDQSPFSFWTALMSGTLAGLVAKYLLDKAFIFKDHSINSTSETARSFFFYAASGLLTTALFWSLQLVFHRALAWEHSKYIGAAIGLSLGYLWKFQLDRRFAFSQSTSS